MRVRDKHINVSLPTYAGTFDIEHDVLGIIATIKVFEEDDEEYTVEVDITPL
jgi:hypothetical protein